MSGRTRIVTARMVFLPPCSNGQVEPCRRRRLDRTPSGSAESACHGSTLSDVRHASRVRENNPERPFCSERCRLLDLGAWADERYVVETDGAEDDGASTSIVDGSAE